MELNDILNNRITTKWWSDKPVEPIKLINIFDAITKAPSKQMRYNYRVVMLGDSPKALEFKQWLYWENTPCLDGIRGKEGPGLKRYNGQVLAPVVLVWIAKQNEKEILDDCMISATIAMLAAENEGLKTGFCSCMEPQQVSEKMKHLLPKEWKAPHQEVGKYATVALGIGYPDKIDTSPFNRVDDLGFVFSDNVSRPLARKVEKDGVEMGFDIGNIDRVDEFKGVLPSKTDLIKIYK